MYLRASAGAGLLLVLTLYSIVTTIPALHKELMTKNSMVIGYSRFLMLKIYHLFKNLASMNYRMLAAIQLLSNQPNNWEPKHLRQGVKNN